MPQLMEGGGDSMLLAIPVPALIEDLRVRAVAILVREEPGRDDAFSAQHQPLLVEDVLRNLGQYDYAPGVVVLAAGDFIIGVDATGDRENAVGPVNGEAVKPQRAQHH